VIRCLAKVYIPRASQLCFSTSIIILIGFLVLWQMERNAAAGRTFGSIPVSTPPPVTSTIAHTKSLTSFQNRDRGQGFGVESGSSHTLYAFEDNNRSAYTDAKPTEFTEAFPLKSSAGHNVMSTAQGEEFDLLHLLYTSASDQVTNVAAWEGLPYVLTFVCMILMKWIGLSCF
jgi:hypothetical protein